MRRLGAPRASVSPCDRDETVPDVADGADQRLVLGAELGPQPADMHVDRPGAAEVVVAPDLLEQLRPGEDPARVLGEELQQLEFLEGQVQRAAAQPGQSSCRLVDDAGRRSGSRRGGRTDVRRPMASRSRASTSPGPAVCRMTSSAPQSAVTAAQPPSVTTASTGTLIAGAAQLPQQPPGLHKITTGVDQDGISGRPARPPRSRSPGPARTACGQQAQGGQDVGRRLAARQSSRSTLLNRRHLRSAVSSAGSCPPTPADDPGRRRPDSLMSEDS